MSLEELNLPMGGVPMTAAEKARNGALLDGYDYDKYDEWITGYNGMNLQKVSVCRQFSAVRTRVGPRGNYKAGLCRLADGSLLIAPCGTIGGVFRIRVYRSADTGLSWTEIGKTELFGKEPSLTVSSNGAILLTAQAYGSPYFERTQLITYVSEDGGVTWEAIPIDGMADYPRNVIVEKDGTLLMILAKAPYDFIKRPFPASSDLELFRSKDRGRSWSRTGGKVDWDNPNFSEITSIRLPGGKLLAAFRVYQKDHIKEGQEATFLSESSDNGITWSKPRVMTNMAECHVWFNLLPGGVLLATYASYHLPFGVFAVASSDGGKNWTYDRPIQLAISAGFYVGWPVTVEVGENDYITSYSITAYSQQKPENTVCETVRWKMPESYL